jgi:hypothetical protein
MSKLPASPKACAAGDLPKSAGLENQRDRRQNMTERPAEQTHKQEPETAKTGDRYRKPCASCEAVETGFTRSTYEKRMML